MKIFDDEKFGWVLITLAGLFFTAQIVRYLVSLIGG